MQRKRETFCWYKSNRKGNCVEIENLPNVEYFTRSFRTIKELIPLIKQLDPSNLAEVNIGPIGCFSS